MSLKTCHLFILSWQLFFNDCWPRLSFGDFPHWNVMSVDTGQRGLWNLYSAVLALANSDSGSLYTNLKWITWLYMQTKWRLLRHANWLQMNCSNGYGRLGHRFKWLSADKIGWTIDTFPQWRWSTVFRLKWDLLHTVAYLVLQDSHIRLESIRIETDH